MGREGCGAAGCTAGWPAARLAVKGMVTATDWLPDLVKAMVKGVASVAGRMRVHPSPKPQGVSPSWHARVTPRHACT